MLLMMTISAGVRGAGRALVLLLAAGLAVSFASLVLAMRLHSPSVRHSRSTTRTPSDGLVVKIVGSSPVAARYSAVTRSQNAPTASFATRFTVQPPKPPPVIRAPKQPAVVAAACTIASSSAHETS